MSNKTKIQPWELILSTKALDERWFSVRKDTVKLPSGKVLDDYFVWESPTIATVVPVTSEGMFVLCRQYRHAVDKIMYQFPAGAVGKAESAEAAAVRELMEETGYQAKKLISLGSSAAYPTKLSGWHHLFLAKDVDQVQEPIFDESEPIEVVVKTVDELWALIQNNEFQVADSMAAALLAFKKLQIL